MKPSVEYGEEQDLPPKKKAKTKRKKWSTKKQLKRSAAAVKEDAAEEGSQASAVLGLASLAPLKFLAPALEEMLEKRLCSFASEEHGMVRRELGTAVEALKVGLAVIVGVGDIWEGRTWAGTCGDQDGSAACHLVAGGGRGLSPRWGLSWGPL
jgi:hypothetical protein